MKYAIFTLLFSVFSFAGFSQSKTDYIAAMKTFQTHYNQHQKDSVCRICTNNLADESGTVMSQKEIDELMQKFGKLNSFQYVEGGDFSNGAMIFRTNFSHSTQFMGITLNKDKKIVKMNVLGGSH